MDKTLNFFFIFFLFISGSSLSCDDLVDPEQEVRQKLIGLIDINDIEELENIIKEEELNINNIKVPNTEFAELGPEFLLHVVITKNKPEVLKLFIKLGGDTELKNKVGNTLLHTVAATDLGTETTEILDFLLTKKADVNATNGTNLTPLHLAALQGKKEYVEKLLQHKSCVNSVDIVNDTPAHRLLYSQERDYMDLTMTVERVEALDALIIHGADVSAENKMGFSVSSMIGNYIHDGEHNGVKITFTDESAKKLLTEIYEEIISRVPDIERKIG